MYLLPAIDILDGRAVRLAKGDYNAVTVYHDDPVAQARDFEAQGAMWLHVVDLNGARSGIPENIAIIEQIIRSTNLKVEVGGGIRSLETVARLADAGVSRMVLGTSLVKNRAFAKDAIDEFGDLLACGIDAKGGEVAIAGWEQGSGSDAYELAREMSDLGYTHIIFTDIARDGMQTGIDPQAYLRMAQAFSHPVIVSGGVAGVDDIYALGPIADVVEGVIAGRAIYEGALSVAEGVAACKQATEMGSEVSAC
ncbi:1-(5-phosphoribosyl)-5-[(5-phosphoribosylamino)methylideneamino]imidazole-4-carboxamide isomerase [Eggerthellaceae bacterium 3-80]|nr:1-(5-phosphoribosyl)-5-[(5-phosphoribosylamino)methylideneamino]imidazole-4-carboxamide isomerase [bacterium D16-34]